MTLNFNYLVFKSTHCSVNHKHLNIQPTHKHRDNHEGTGDTSFASLPLSQGLITSPMSNPKEIVLKWIRCS